ncbi:MAG: Rieske 2Fe-2S domain-containing protein [Azospirillaceae bacterium]
MAAGYVKACDLDDVWEGEMDVFEVDGREVLIVHAPGGEVRAYDPVCPHQDQPLIEGELDDCILTCAAHLWQFDVRSGKGVNPEGVSLTAYPVRVDDGAVLVDLPDKAGRKVAT